MPQPSSNQVHTLSWQGKDLTAPGVPGAPATVTATVAWTNSFGHPIFVIGGYIWVGEGMGGRSDTAVKLTHLQSGDVLINDSWDHYAEPCGAPDNLIPFSIAPYWFLIEPGDTIELYEGVRGPYSNAPCTISATVHLYYLT